MSNEFILYAGNKLSDATDATPAPNVYYNKNMTLTITLKAPTNCDPYVPARTILLVITSMIMGNPI